MISTDPGPGQGILVFVLAGGQGERLHPLTRDRAKPAVPFGGAYRIIDFTLSNCINSNLRRIHVLTQYKSLSLERHIRQGWSILNERLGEFIVTIPPQQRLGGSWYLGTADAVFQNIYTLEKERPLHVLILAGDHVYKMDYRRMIQFHLERDADLTIACLEVGREETPHLGIAGVDADGRIRRWQEKPQDPVPIPGQEDRYLASMGVYIFRTEVLVRRASEDAKQRSDHDFGKNVIPGMIDTNRVYAFPFSEGCPAVHPYWRDIGRRDAYYEANLDLLAPEPLLDLHDPAWPIWICPRSSPPARILGGTVGEARDCLLSPGVILDRAHVQRSILGYDVVVERGAQVTESILLDGVTVGAGARVHRAILDKRVAVPPGETMGIDPEADARRFTRTDEGVVIVPTPRADVWPSGTPAPPPGP